MWDGGGIGIYTMAWNTVDAVQEDSSSNSDNTRRWRGLEAEIKGHRKVKARSKDPLGGLILKDKVPNWASWWVVAMDLLQQDTSTQLCGNLSPPQRWKAPWLPSRANYPVLVLSQVWVQLPSLSSLFLPLVLSSSPPLCFRLLHRPPLLLWSRWHFQTAAETSLCFHPVWREKTERKSEMQTGKEKVIWQLVQYSSITQVATRGR